MLFQNAHFCQVGFFFVNLSIWKFPDGDVTPCVDHGSQRPRARHTGSAPTLPVKLRLPTGKGYVSRRLWRWRRSR
jgi:hypothetical protein